ncbi:MAG: hypothetical protein DRJ03_28605 [Chloroflexi bacterium]|nr:MAG: hypothetical protein DRJ03_28605 [Chloroflexota bacterium]
MSKAGKLNRKFYYAIIFYVFALCLDAIMTAIYGDVYREENRYILVLAKTFSFKIAVAVYSVSMFLFAFILTYAAYKLDLGNTCFFVSLIFTMSHLYGAFTWVVSCGESIKISVIIAVIYVLIYDLVTLYQHFSNEKRMWLNG